MTVNYLTAEEAMDKLCDLMPKEIDVICREFVSTYGKDIIDAIDKDANADEVCQTIDLCVNPKCELYSGGSSSYYISPEIEVKSSVPKETPWQWLEDLVNKLTKDHLPIIDDDGDNYSTILPLRGGNWRGRDCDDGNPHIHSGRAVPPPSATPGSDFNCNGIHGFAKNGSSYKDLFCKDYPPIGVTILGGSACSHFEIDPHWVNVSEIKEGTYDDLFRSIMNEVDIPHKSWATGYAPSEKDKPVDSIYLRLRERNRCNHRDFQNIGVNGASSSNIVDNVKTLSRNHQTDHPMLVIYNPLGDDVCNMHIDDTISRMTTVPEFHANVMKALEYLDGVLPPNSHVLFVGLANGSILWDLLANRTHPLGMTYRKLYHWMTCIDFNPCVGWLTTNATLRQFTTQRAADLSNVYPKIVKEEHFKNFDMAYLPFPLAPIMKEWEKQGGDPADLIEPVDGFHPSQLGNYLFGGWIFKWLENNHPSFLGEINPNNKMIDKVFGTQGGY